MKKLLLIALTLCLSTSLAHAEYVTYGWEDGGTILGQYGDIIATNVGAPDPVHSGDHSLKLEDAQASGTPQAYIAFIWNLQDGDVVTVGFWRYDITPGTAPSCRVWAHWNDELPGNPDGYSGSASGNSDYGPGEGWDFTYYDWTVDGHTGIVIECRTYSSAGDIVWIDDMEITTPDHAYIQIPGDSPIGTENQTWGGVKTLYK